MSTQLNLLGRSVKVRPTSIEARRSITKEHISAVKAAILFLLRRRPMTDQELCREIYEASDSGIRTRRSELVKSGHVVAAGITKNSRGLKVNVWRLA